MKTRFKFIHFEKMYRESEKREAQTYACRSNKSDDLLGGVEYYKPWKQFIFVAHNEGVFQSVFSASCLDDISEFMKGLNK